MVIQVQAQKTLDKLSIEMSGGRLALSSTSEHTAITEKLGKKTTRDVIARPRPTYPQEAVVPVATAYLIDLAKPWAGETVQAQTKQRGANLNQAPPLSQELIAAAKVILQYTDALLNEFKGKAKS